MSSDDLAELCGFHSCDACGLRSQEAWYRAEDQRDFTLCGHHSHALQDGLHKAGYRLIAVAREEARS